MLDIGQSEDWLALQIAMAPCLLGYFAVAEMLTGHPDTVREGNTFWPWIENYVADDYTEAVRLGSGTLYFTTILLAHCYHLLLCPYCYCLKETWWNLLLTGFGVGCW